MLRKVSVAFAVLVVLAAALCAQEMRVRTVTVTGVAGDQAGEVQRRIRVRPGDAYSDQTVQEDYLAILGLPFVQSAAVTKSDTAEGVDLTYEVRVRETVTAIRFAGNRKIKAKKLKTIGRLEGVRHYDLARLNTARELILGEYIRKGYVFAKVDFSSQSDGSVLFTIDEGKRTRVARVNILGNTHFSDRLLRKQIRTRTRRYLILRYRLDRDAVEEDATNLREFYRNRGYLDASVKVRLDVDEKTGKRFTVDYIIDEGVLYTVGTIAIEGNSIIADADLRARLSMTEGKPFSPEGLSRDVGAIADAYGIIGHIDAEVRPATTIAAEAPQVSVLYRIAEGQTIYVNEVVITGNDRTRDNVIRRELEFAPGQRFNTEAVGKSRRNLNRHSYFSKIEIEPQRTADPVKRDVIVNVEETSTGQLIIGVGADSDSGVTGQIAYIQRNFDYTRPPSSWRDLAEGRAWVGGGQTFSLDAMPGTDVDRLLVSYRDPRVDDSDYSLGLAGERYERGWDSYAERRTSGTVSVGKAFGENASWEVSATARNVKISDIDLYDRNKDGFVTLADTPDYLAEVRGSNQVNLLGLTLRHDTRNSFFYPTDGHAVSAEVEASSNALASEYDFLRFDLDGRWYRELKKDELDRPFVLSWRAHSGIFIPKSGADDSPIFERFFLGGSTDVRGFDARGIGPHDGDTALGGEFMVYGGLQYDWPLAGESLRGALFWDAGTLVDSPGDFRLSDIRHSVGFGIMLRIPPPVNYPFAIYFGFPLSDEDEDDTRVISILFGRSI